MLRRLAGDGRAVKAVYRKGGVSPPVGGEVVEIGNLGSMPDWNSVLESVDAVVHLAARVHVMHDTSTDPLMAFREINTSATLRLARQAADRGVRRFVFLSSVKVLGESGVFSGADDPAPQDPYAISKLEAEDGLREIARSAGMELVVLRPPLVYGPGVGANFLRLMRAVDAQIPFPFGAVNNRRSLVFLANLVDAISLALDHPLAAGRTFLVSDGEDVSTPELIRKVAEALGRPYRLLPVPPSLMRFAGRLIGKGKEVDRLLGNLAVDISALRCDLGWAPPYTMERGLAATAQWYRQEHPR